MRLLGCIAGSWSWALFAPSAFFFVTGAAVFCTLGSSDAQDFSDDRPFWCAAFPLMSDLSGITCIKLQAGSVQSRLSFQGARNL